MARWRHPGSAGIGRLSGMAGALVLTREQILAYRRRVQALDKRLPAGPGSLRQAAWAGLQDSVPRSAMHALYARVEGVGPDAWEDPSLSQVWGPRYTAYVVPAGEHLPFTLGRLPERGRLRERAEDLAARLHESLRGRRLPVDEAAAGIGIHDNSIRYASLTGMVLIRWGGARQPTIWTVPHEVDPLTARVELMRRYLHCFGPATIDAVVRWGGLDGPSAAAAFKALAPSLVRVRTPLGEAQMLAEDEPALREPVVSTNAARLLPSGDPYYLLWGADRELLVDDAARRAELWTTRVWPGALLVGGEIAGTWRRAKAAAVVTPWRPLSEAERGAVEAEASKLPLPEVAATSVSWDDGAG
jgi:DNA glycosylase AlkZ-like